MIAIAYLVPVVGCLVLYFLFGYAGSWQTYAIVFACGEATVGLCHRLCYKSFTSCTEYLGSMIRSIHYEAPWTERIVRTETKTDAKGRTYTRTYVQYVYHPAKHYFHTSIGSRYPMNAAYFHEVKTLWGVRKHSDTWTGPHIQGGVRFGHHYILDDLGETEIEKPIYWIPVTEKHSYKNKIRSSNSIFKFEKISREQAAELGLHEYPAIINNDAPCILSTDLPIPPDADVMFRKFNARYGPGLQIRLYILLFDAEKGIGISEMQRAYWQGGNKNEFVVCMGLDADRSVKWARAFSWADEQNIEVEAAQWLMHHPRLEWAEFYEWLKVNLLGWKRKEFSDFDYINVTLPLKYFLIVLFASILENSLAIYLVLENLQNGH